jgi:sterol desaturase/sphingolipid hydroxylase (fatty acid hydroxylase superfamily)
MWDFLFDYGAEAVIALSFWLLSRAIPFRRLDAAPEIRWDIVGVVVAFAGSTAVSLMLDFPTDMAIDAVAGSLAMLNALPIPVMILAYLLVADMGAYWAHRLLHTRALWPTHAWHHSSRHLYVLSGLRSSPIHILVLFVPYAMALILFPITETGVAGLAVIGLQIANQHYIHSNIRVPFEQQLEYVFVTPRFHFVHHSATMHFTNSNYGFIFSLWDRMFGSYTRPEAVPANDLLGLDYDISKLRLIVGLPPRS